MIAAITSSCLKFEKFIQSFQAYFFLKYKISAPHNSKHDPTNTLWNWEWCYKNKPRTFDMEWDFYFLLFFPVLQNMYKVPFSLCFLLKVLKHLHRGKTNKIFASFSPKQFANIKALTSSSPTSFASMKIASIFTLHKT